MKTPHVRRHFCILCPGPGRISYRGATCLGVHFGATPRQSAQAWVPSGDGEPLCVWGGAGGVCSLSSRSTSKSLVGSRTELKPQVGMWPSSGDFPDSTRRNVLLPEPSSPSTSTSRCSSSSSAGSSSSSSSGCGAQVGCGLALQPGPSRGPTGGTTASVPPAPRQGQAGTAWCHGTSVPLGIPSPQPRSAGLPERPRRIAYAPSRVQGAGRGPPDSTGPRALRRRRAPTPPAGKPPPQSPPIPRIHRSRRPGCPPGAGGGPKPWTQALPSLARRCPAPHSRPTRPTRGGGRAPRPTSPRRGPSAAPVRGRSSSSRERRAPSPARPRRRPAPAPRGSAGAAPSGRARGAGRRPNQRPPKMAPLRLPRPRPPPTHPAPHYKPHNAPPPARQAARPGAGAGAGARAERGTSAPSAGAECSEAVPGGSGR